MICGVTGNDTNGVVVVTFHQVEQGAACGFGAGHGSQIPSVVFAQQSEEVSSGSIFCQAVEAPGGSSFCNVGSIAGVNTVINDLLCESFASLVQVCPESGLSRFVPEGVVGVVFASFYEQVEQSIHTASVFLHTFDGLCKQRGRTIIGRVTQNIVGEDDVIDRDGGAIGEGEVVSQGEIVVNGSIRILGDLYVCRSIVGVVRSVVGDRRAFDTFFDDSAHTVGVQQTDLGHCVDILVVRGFTEERRELAGERRISYYQRSFIRLGLVCSALFAGAAAGACSQAKDHGQSQHQCEHLS